MGRSSSFEYIGKSILLEDVCDQLPHHPTKHWGHRDYRCPIEYIVVHHTDGSVRHPGLSGAAATAKFHSDPDKPETDGVDGRSWPGIAYHLYIPYFPSVVDAKLVCYRTQPDDRHLFHTGSPWNSKAIAIVFQGSFKSSHNPLGIEPSGHQLAVWNELRPYLLGRLGLTDFDILPHAWLGKPACPGSTIVGWLMSERNKAPDRITSKEQLREQLSELGFYSSDDGYSLRIALEKFQSLAGIDADGVFGPLTETFIRRARREKGLA